MIRIAKDVLSINLAVMENLAELNEYGSKLNHFCIYSFAGIGS